jgi:acyl-CoA-binding protein
MKPLPVGKIVNLPEQYHYTSWAELKADNERLKKAVEEARNLFVMLVDYVNCDDITYEPMVKEWLKEYTKETK